MLERNILDDNLTLSAYVLKQRLDGREPKIGLVLGSGLNPLANEIADAVSIPYVEVPRMKTSTAEGHVGRFVCGTLGGKCVLAMQGRLHAYEGNNAQEVAYPVWLMERLGVRTLITTNASCAPSRTTWPPSGASACRRACTWARSAPASRRRPRSACSARGAPTRWP